MKNFITPALLGALLLPSSAVLAAGADISALESRIAELEGKLGQIEETSSQGPAVGSSHSKSAHGAISKSWLGKEYVASGNKKMKVALSGQINRGITYVDDGVNGVYRHVDSDYSNSRFRVAGQGNLGNGIEVGSVLEVAALYNFSPDMNQFSSNDEVETGMQMRHFDIYVDVDSYGRFSMGHGSSSTDSVAEMSLDNGWLAEYSYPVDAVSGYYFRPKGVDRDAFTANNGVQLLSVYDNFDGGRHGRVRYDSPVYSGFKFSTSLMRRGEWDAALQHNWQNDVYETLAAIGYRSEETRDHSAVMGSLSAKHKSSGLSVTYNGGQKTLDDDATNRQNDPVFSYFKIALDKDLNSFGQTTLAVGYYMGDDIGQDRDESTSFGLGIVQNIDAINSEAYFMIRNYDFERTGATSYDDLTLVMLGARVKF